MEALLQLKGIDKAFPGVKALSGAALNVYPGRVITCQPISLHTFCAKAHCLFSQCRGHCLGER